MSIPKRISYCWFGQSPLPNKVKQYIDSWQRMCPDYEIIQWNESNYDVNKIPFIRDAYKEKKWAFVADYARLDIIYQTGGIYLDTDVELLKSLDPLMEEKIFLAIEKSGLWINTGLGFGAEKGNVTIKNLCKIYEKASFYHDDGSLNLKQCTLYATEYFEQNGFVREDRYQKVGEVAIFPSEYFCPMNFDDGSLFITQNTIGIHWYDASWFSESDRKIYKVERLIRQKLPLLFANPTCKLYRNIYRLGEYTKKRILLKKLKEKWKKA